MKLSIAELSEDCFPEGIMIGKEDAALTDRVKARVLAEIAAEQGRIGTGKKRVSLRAKRIVTLALAAALTLALGAVAYAISSIHAARQQELRADLNMSESHTESYVEYQVPAEDAQGLVLLSAINDGNFQKVYVNVSPVTREDLDRYPDELLFMWELEGREGFGMASPRLNQARSVFGHEEILAAVLEDAYDAETQTLTLYLAIPNSAIRERQRETGADSITLTVWPWDLQAWERAGVNSLADWMHGQPSFGSISIRPTDREVAAFDLGHALCRDPESGKELELVSLELGPTGAVWRLRYEGLEEDETRRDEEALLAAGNAADRMIRATRIDFADGTSLSLPGCMSAPFENGTLNCYIGWERAVDIHAVQRIVLGERILWENKDGHE